jgi:group I intron endonuclease
MHEHWFLNKPAGPLARVSRKVGGVWDSSGVYAIYCKGNGKVYVGSSNKIGKRLVYHKHSLRKNKHHSVLLQRSYNKYGEGEFIVVILDPCSVPASIKIEQFYIDALKACDSRFGFNTNKEAGRTVLSKRILRRIAEKRSSSYHLVKNGIHYKGKNVYRFAKKHNISHSAILQVVNGRYKASNGFYLPETTMPKPHTIVDPNGRLNKFYSIRKFAKKHGLHPSTLRNVLLGKSRHTAGFHLASVELEKPKVHKLVHTDGRIAKFSNINKFARDIGCFASHVSTVVNGKCKSCRGWHRPGIMSSRITMKSIKSPTGQVYNFYNCKEFAATHGLSASCVASVVSGKAKQTKGWTSQK